LLAQQIAKREAVGSARVLGSRGFARRDRAKCDRDGQAARDHESSVSSASHAATVNSLTGASGSGIAIVLLLGLRGRGRLGPPIGDAADSAQSQSPKTLDDRVERRPVLTTVEHRAAVAL
jgi:hypothetical protein